MWMDEKVCERGRSVIRERNYMTTMLEEKISKLERTLCKQKEEEDIDAKNTKASSIYYNYVVCYCVC